MAVLGIDIGGSGIKGALVDLDAGDFLGERHRIKTPEKSTPSAVAEVILELVRHFQYDGPIGCGFPAVIRDGVACSAANIDQKWIGTNADQLFSESTGNPVYTLNDADAAGLAEMTYGVGREQQRGVVLMLTLGTGIGTALFLDGKLLPNTELGHVEIRGKDAERRASDAARKKKGLTFYQWSERLQEVLDTYEKLFSPDVIIVGGGVSKHADEFLPLLKTRAVLKPAYLRNKAGTIGAAVYARQRSTAD